MAFMKGVYGDFSGRIGELVFRAVNGKTVVASRGKRYQSSQTAAAIERRNKFSTAFKFAKAIKSNALLKALWVSTSTNSANACNKILSANYRFVNNLQITVHNIITPESFDPSPVKYMSMSGKSVDVEIYDDTYIDKEGKLIVFASVIDPVSDGLPMCDTFEVYEGHVAAGMYLSVELSDQKFELCRKYKRYILYAAFVSQISSDKFVWTRTCAREGSFVIISKEK